MPWLQSGHTREGSSGGLLSPLQFPMEKQSPSWGAGFSDLPEGHQAASGRYPGHLLFVFYLHHWPQAGLAVAQVEPKGSWARSFGFPLGCFRLQVTEYPANSGLTNTDI